MYHKYVRITCTRMKELLTGLENNAYHSIASREVGENAHVAYDLHQVIRHRLAWDRHPEGGIQVYFDEPLPVSGKPIARN